MYMYVHVHVCTLLSQNNNIIHVAIDLLVLCELHHHLSEPIYICHQSLGPFSPGEVSRG